MCAVKDDQSVVIDRKPDQDKSQEPSGPHIRCPLCGWSPRKNDLWSCDCGHYGIRSTLQASARACLHQWAETQCLSCARWSAHSDWYTR